MLRDPLRNVVTAAVLVLISGWVESRSVAAEGQVLKAQYEQDRFIVTPVVAGGQTMRLLADTGGGVFFFDDSAQRLKLPVSGVSLNEYKGMAAKFPEFEPGSEIPIPKTEGDVVPLAPGPVRMHLSWLKKDIDGILGQGWFGERVWTLDYPARKLIYHPDGKATHSEQAHKLAMGFGKDEKGQRISYYPRIEVVVSGQTLDVLIASGSSVALSAEALKAIDEGGSSIRATSLIATTTFEQWKKDHPDWRVVPNAEEGAGEPMILVPELTIAGFKVTNVWFTQRPDNNFSENFSKWMDKPVIGAIGGNVLKEFRIILNYPASEAWLEKP